MASNVMSPDEPVGDPMQGLASNRPGDAISAMDVDSVLSTAMSWKSAGHDCALLTVLSTFGGSPRPPGSIAVIRDDGVICGSVSGGCVEDDLAHELRGESAFARQPSLFIRVFGVDADQRARYRLPCNNTIRIAVETQWDPNVVRDAIERVARREPVRRHVAFATGRSWLQPTTRHAQFEENLTHFAVPLGPTHEALVIGCNDIGRRLADLLLTLDFDVHVCDPREEYAGAWAPSRTPLSREMPDDWIRARRVHDRMAVIAVSHDPKIDDLALLEALSTEAFYVGAIGSVATSARRRERLELLGLAPGHVARLKGPVGLQIGSRTPAEIAVSIAADLIRHRRFPVDFAAD